MLHAVARLIGFRIGAAALRPAPVLRVLRVVIITTGTVVPDAANGMM